MCPPSALGSSPHDETSHTAHIPSTRIAQAAYQQAASALAAPILNHSMRVYMYASALATHTASAYAHSPAKHDLLFAACLLHDVGTAAAFDDSPHRFEVEGADAAVTLLSQHGVSAEDRHDVWTAIACHTSPQIAERIGELARLVRVAVVTDFGRESEAGDVLGPLKGELEARYQRAGVEKVLGDAVVAQAVRRPGKAPMVSWPGVMYRAHLEEPEWEGVNRMF